MSLRELDERESPLASEIESPPEMGPAIRRRVGVHRWLLKASPQVLANHQVFKSILAFPIHMIHKRRSTVPGPKQMQLNIPAIRARISNGESRRNIARSLGVSPSLLTLRLRSKPRESVYSVKGFSASLLRRYHLPLEKYLQMLIDQQGLCALCFKPLGVGHPSIDHDHACCVEHGRSCGKCIRGVVHHKCNQMLGFAGDNPEILEAGARYLQSFKK
jgi:hypothetical protein